MHRERRGRIRIFISSALLLLLLSLCLSSDAATRQKTWATGNTITANDLNSDWDNFYSEKVTTANLADSAVTNSKLATITTAGKINVTALIASGQATDDMAVYDGAAWAAENRGYHQIAWAKFNGATGVIADSYNVTSVVNNAAGDYSVNWSITFGNATYCVVNTSNTAMNQIETGTQATTTLDVNTKDSTGAATNVTEAYILAIGD